MRWLLLVSLAFARGDAPEISRSVGKKGGVVVLWPRTGTSETSKANAAKVQAALVKIAGDASTVVDVRPEPERACPRATGCKATALGAVVVAQGDGCVVLATVSAPGLSSTKLVPWVGEMTLKTTSVPFREPPEAQVTVTDFARCDALVESLGEREADVVKALRAAVGG